MPFVFVICLLHSDNNLQVDKHIRKLDADLARFEAELKEKANDSKKDGWFVFVLIICTNLY